MLAKKMCLTMFAAILMSLLFAQSVAAAPNVKVFFNGNEIYYDVPPQIIMDRTMVPIAATVRAITGSEVKWDGATSTISFNSFGRYITHRIGETVVYVDGAPYEFPTPSLIIDGRTLVPIQMIAKTADCQVVWDAANRYVIITRQITPVAPVPPVTPPVPPVTPVHPIATIPTINRVDADKTSVYTGESITLTVRTNTEATDVWIHYDNTDLYAARYTTDPAGYRVWAITFYPARSQTVTIYANTSRSLTGAAQQTKRITVGTYDVKIYDVYADKTNVTYGDSVYISVKTSEDVTTVRGEDGNRTIQFTYRSTNSYGQKTWTATYYPESTAKVWIYARADGGNDVSDSIRIYVEQRAVRPEIYTVTVDPGYVIGNNVQENNFTVTTNTAVTSVYVDVGGRRFYADSNPRSQGGNLVWYINGVPLQTNVSVGGSFSVDVIAENRDGQTTSRSTSITIRPGIAPL